MCSFRSHVPWTLCYVVWFIFLSGVDCTLTPAPGPIPSPAREGPAWVVSTHTLAAIELVAVKGKNLRVDTTAVRRRFLNYRSYRTFRHSIAEGKG